MTINKLLMITTKPLIPNNDGYTIRMFNILKCLKNKGFHITLISFQDKSAQEQYNSELKSICDEYYQIEFDRQKAYKNSIKAIFTGKPFKAEYYTNRKIKNAILNLTKNKQYDYVCGYHYLTSQFLDLFPNSKKWIDLCDAISMLHEKNYKKSKSILNKFFLYSERKRVLKVEKHCIKNYDLVTLISNIDKMYLHKYTDTSCVNIIKNGINIPAQIQTNYNNNEICFLGDMSYVQNHEAAKYFILKILPELKKINENITFKIIGKNPKRELYSLAQNNHNIIITGRVTSVFEELKTANIMVCPIFISAGLQNKVLESMALGIPAIVTKQVAEPITTNENILLQANNIEEWIKIILQVMDDPQLRNSYSVAANDYVRKNFCWEKEVSKLGII